MDGTLNNASLKAQMTTSFILQSKAFILNLRESFNQSNSFLQSFILLSESVIIQSKSFILESKSFTLKLKSFTEIVDAIMCILFQVMYPDL